LKGERSSFEGERSSFEGERSSFGGDGDKNSRFVVKKGSITCQIMSGTRQLQS
jgi:hypothetical protein